MIDHGGDFEASSVHIVQTGTGLLFEGHQSDANVIFFDVDSVGDILLTTLSSFNMSAGEHTGSNAPIVVNGVVDTLSFGNGQLITPSSDHIDILRFRDTAVVSSCIFDEASILIFNIAADTQSEDSNGVYFEDGAKVERFVYKYAAIRPASDASSARQLR